MIVFFFFLVHFFEDYLDQGHPETEVNTIFITRQILI